MNRKVLLLFLLHVQLMLVASEAAESSVKTRRKGKLLPIFQVYSFRNGPCQGGTKNGTCYTSQECTNKGGTAEGSCASNFGVCCTFSRGCGATSSENCTYFESGGATAGACTLEICKCSSNICQLRLDFNQFIITGPSTDTNSIGKILNGLPATGGTAVTSTSQCLTDTFVATNPGGIQPPTICGINTGEHMYLDASDDCNTLAFQLGTTGIGTGISNRQWSIKVNQYSCDYENLAPEGCTQYFFGSTVQQVQTYNFDGGQHLANQEQTICVRRERGNCRICWTTAQDSDFMISGSAANLGHTQTALGCCGYGTNGVKKTAGFDCVMIPGALNPMTTSQFTNTVFCGKSKGLVTTTGTMAVTVCSDRVPFEIDFISDGFDWEAESIGSMQGFRLTYIQSSSNC